MDQPFDICPATERHGERIEAEVRLQRIRHVPTDDSSRVQVHRDR
jgi:hypothetical protein